MNIQGKITEIFKTQDVNDTFKKREFVIEYATNPAFPQTLKFEVIQNNCGILDNFSVGDFVEVTFDLKGRRWVNPQGKEYYFTTLSAFKLEKLNGIAQSQNDSSVEPPDDFFPDDSSPF